VRLAATTKDCGTIDLPGNRQKGHAVKSEHFEFKFAPGLVPHAPGELRGRARGSGRMIVLDRASQAIRHEAFSSIDDYLCRGDLLVLNDSYVLPNAIMFNHGERTVSVILCGHEPGGFSIVGFRPTDVPAPGLRLTAAEDSQLHCRVIAPLPRGLWKVAFEPAERLVPTLEQHGRQYGGSHEQPTGVAKIGERTQLSYRQSTPAAYRSVYAKTPGSLQIPSAGLHFSEALLARLVAKGVELAYVTLHVGATELLSVRHISEYEVEHHQMRSEFFAVGELAARQVSQALAEKRRIVAVGTTVLRTLETLGLDLAPGMTVRPRTGWTDLYIYPGFAFKVADALLTNLHRPRSTHLVLTSAFGGHELVMRSYAEALENGAYEFDMFGDSMLIV
jgi:S-adenosylmethionine:tRNA ribosyltransferase-isomerase